MLLAFAVAAAELAVAGNAPVNYTLTADPVNLTLTVADAYLSAAGSEVLTADPVSLVFTVAPASLVARLQMRPDPVNLSLTVAPATLTFNPRLVAGPTNLTFTVASADLVNNSGADPESIALAGLQAVYNLASTIGPTGSFTHTSPADLGSYSTVTGNTYGVNGGATYMDFDFDGSDIYLAGGTYSISNFQSKHTNGGNYVLAIGHPNFLGTAAHVTLTDGVVDQTNTLPDKGNVDVANGSLTATRVKFIGASATNIDTFWPLTFTDVFFDSMGQNVAGDDHTENIHFHLGTHVLTRVLHDARNGNPGASDATGLIYVEADVGDVDVTYNDSVIVGAQHLAIYCPIQICAKGSFTATMRFNNCVIEAGTGGNPYFIPVGGDCHAIFTNCRDFATGAIIDGLVNSISP